MLNDNGNRFEVTVVFRSVDCEVIKSSPAEQDHCKSCSTALNYIKKTNTRKTRSSEAPAKPKAPIAMCGPEKLRATLKATRLQCKDLEERLHNLENQIEQDGFGVSEATATRLQCKDLEERLNNLENQIEQDGFGVSEATEKRHSQNYGWEEPGR
jgi:chromosome segregation ATPase